MACNYCLLDFGTPAYKSEYWQLTVSNEQSYLGRIFLFLNRHAESISDLTEAEWSDLLHVMKKFESAAKQSFGARLFNWTCLMNNAFQEKDSKPHVHWHCRPRYDHEVEFAGLTFSDQEFGHHYSRDRNKKVSSEVVVAIQKELLKYLK